MAVLVKCGGADGLVPYHENQERNHGPAPVWEGKKRNLKVESPALENPKVENSNWTGSRRLVVQFKFSTFGFSNAGLSTFHFRKSRLSLHREEVVSFVVDDDERG